MTSNVGKVIGHGYMSSGSINGDNWKNMSHWESPEKDVTEATKAYKRDDSYTLSNFHGSFEGEDVFVFPYYNISKGIPWQYHCLLNS